jgi:hypothetical protein
MRARPGPNVEVSNSRSFVFAVSKHSPTLEFASTTNTRTPAVLRVAAAANPAAPAPITMH